MILEMTSWFAVHRHFDPVPSSISDRDAKSEVQRVLRRSFEPKVRH